ncbi:hypothetical protein Syun_014433 [Stephania yunnanensis]|uniref:Uncharacterized protein n=1 Tax=Stephania yunnanensis TaxID=152371 RepID=A0AAP0JJC0_9MAGN
MFSLLRRGSFSEIHPTLNLLLLQTQFLRPISSSSTNPSNQSFTLSYLLNSCGLSPESALSASKKVRFKSPSKPDSVLHFLRNHGFSDTQIANLITKRPLLLLAKPQHTLLPKLKFLNELGLSEPEVAHYLSTDPTILFRGLESKIKPSYEYLKSLLGTDENVAATIKSSCSSWIFNFDLRRVIGQKVEILRKYGVPEKNIAKLVMVRPQSLSKNGDRFEELVENISEMGLNPSSMQFVNALYIFAGMSVSTLESKLRVFESYGWSEDEIVSAIRNQPVCISISKEKLNEGLNFFMNKLKWEPSKLAKDANLLGLSLEKRVIPRWMVIQYLHSKCLIKDAVSIRCVLKLTEAKFLDKFLDKYKCKAPKIMKLYRGTSRLTFNQKG